MLNQDTITEQLALLATHRRTLAHLMAQAAQYGGEVFTPPQTANGIAAARTEIQRIKAALREGGRYRLAKDATTISGDLIASVADVRDRDAGKCPREAEVDRCGRAGGRV